MRHAGSTRRALAALLIAGSVPVAVGETTAGDEDLASAMAEVDAADGLVDAELLLGEPETRIWPTGRARIAMRRRPDGAVWPGGRIELQRGAITAAGRWRRDDDGRHLAGWIRLEGARFGICAGQGVVRHGTGMLQSAIGARTSLDLHGTLLGLRHGWRGSTSVTAADRLTGMWGRWQAGSFAMVAGAGRDEAGASAVMAQVSWRTARDGLDVLGMRRATQTGVSLAAGRERGRWRAEVELARWRGGDAGDGAAASVALRCRLPSGRLELRASTSEAAGGMAGGRRPAGLGSWRARAITVRMTQRLGDDVRASLLLLSGRERDDGDAPVATAARERVEMSLRGRFGETGRWTVRARQRVGRRWTWHDDEPWLAPTLEAAPERLDVSTKASGTAADGEVAVRWRWRREGVRARHLLTAGWTRRHRQWRLRTQWQLAWGDDLDLVTLGVPAPGYYLVQHWGRWASGAWVAVERRGAWRWSVAAALRWPSDRTGPVQLDGRIGVDVPF
ncbi:hypothetical protein GF314_15950 [bacterium]|nr:hypothetical protein [bacterium]